MPLDTPLVRIALTRASSASTLILSAEPGTRLVAQEGRTLAAGAGPWTLKRDNQQVRITNARGELLAVGKTGDVWRAQSEDAEALIGVAASEGKTRMYRGSLEIRQMAGKWSVINEVALESYLRGVVGSEMDGRAPLEALKAQAIACRTFALYRMLRRRAPEDFDLRDDSQEQVYHGADAERTTCDRAVRETEGLILTREGAPAAAFYGADCGGITAPGANANDFPPSVADTDAHGSPDNPRPPAWTLRFAPEALTRLLRKSAALRGMGTLEALEVVEKDGSERARILRLAWRVENEQAGAGQSHEITGEAFRSLLGVSVLRSTKFSVQREEKGDFVLTGRGSGHGRGMCQTGAMALAAPPFSQACTAILGRYYPGAPLGRIHYEDPEEP